ncbi:hypothetical protein KR51_00000040 [Rubidibacter lacunae KORDI 51-2]|uniref:Uncharacterized protein n=1 Tax=Rubidibacter lacunae KORDI 51-2 TaxID=582515 RepID=U5DN90_9CHRO|nr:hypothetical protein KR51_00000040 [Rubidibacter lacunae KORDI 51-2]
MLKSIDMTLHTAKNIVTKLVKLIPAISLTSLYEFKLRCNRSCPAGNVKLPPERKFVENGEGNSTENWKFSLFNLVLVLNPGDRS